MSNLIFVIAFRPRNTLHSTDKYNKTAINCKTEVRCGVRQHYTIIKIPKKLSRFFLAWIWISHEICRKTNNIINKEYRSLNNNKNASIWHVKNKLLNNICGFLCIRVLIVINIIVACENYLCRDILNFKWQICACVQLIIRNNCIATIFNFACTQWPLAIVFKEQNNEIGSMKMKRKWMISFHSS